jgi:hypothetical protein
VALAGYATPGTLPADVAGWGPIWAAKLIMVGLLGLVAVVVWRLGRRSDGDLTLLRLVAIPLAAYLLLATTVHPWYVTLIVPLLPFLPAGNQEAARYGRFVWPALYFSMAVVLSYLTYLDPTGPREYGAIRLVEYVPLYSMLIWAALPRIRSTIVGRPGTD